MPRNSNTAVADNTGDGQPGASNGATIDGVTPTPSEIKFIFALIANLKSKPDINWEGLAATMGVKGKKSAYERWRLIRIKYGFNAEDAAAAGTEAPASPGRKATKKTPTKAAAQADDNSGEEEEDDAEAATKPAPTTPAKRGRKRAAPTAAATPAGGAGGAAGSSAGEEGTPAKKAKGKGKGRAVPATPAKKEEEDDEDDAGPSPFSEVPELTADDGSDASGEMEE